MTARHPQCPSSPRRPSYARVLAPGVTLAMVDYPAGLVQPRHRDDCAQVSLVLAGGVREVTDRGDAVARPLDVLCKGFELPHGDVFAPAPTRILSLRLEPKLDPETGTMPGTAVPLGTWGCRQIDPRLLAQFQLGALAFSIDPALIDSALLALDLQTLLREPGLTRRGRPPAWLVRARERLSEEFRAPVRLGALALNAGVHPVTLSRAFRVWFGETASELVTRLRVRDAAARLAQADRMSEVAYAAGFADQSHLTRQFRRATGLTPGRFRWLQQVELGAGQRGGAALNAGPRRPGRRRPRGGTGNRPAPIPLAPPDEQSGP